MVFKGALLLGDISGFTAITELLTRSGKHGTEELTALLNSYFDKMLSIVENHDGSVITFSGDSLLVRFNEKEKALKCAKAMLDAMTSFRNISILNNSFTLKAKVIVGSGEWNQYVIGNDTRAHILLSGGLIKELARREAEASDDALIHFHSSSKASTTQLECPCISDEAFLSPGSERLLGEHRSVTAAFLSVHTEESGHHNVENFQRLYLDILNSVSRFGGYLHHIDDMLQGGSRILILFGAPVSQGDDIHNSLLAISEIFSRKQNRYGFSISCGIETGYVFSGTVGNHKRRQYTVIGDPVNTAARLADNTGTGTINVSESVYNRTRTRFAYTELPGITVKGKNKPLKRFMPTGKLISSYGSVPFVGREEELEEVIRLLDESDGIVLISGNAGIGKSSLLAKLNEILALKGFSTMKVARTKHGPTSEILISIVADICGISPDMNASDSQRMLHDFLKASGSIELTTREVYLSRMLFGFDFPHKTFKTLPPRLRRENLLEAITLLIRELPSPACIIIEDIHYSDLEEMTSLLEVVRNVLRESGDRISFILSTRPDDRIFFNETDAVAEFQLEGLKQEQSFKLLEEVAEENSINDEILHVLSDRSQGNPFFLVQFFLYLKEKHLILLKKGSWEKAGDNSLDSLPESIFSMIMARIDTLAESARESLKVASVVGVKFDESLIEQIIRREVHSDLIESSHAGLTFALKVSELEYIFSHMLIRDVAYDSMLREWRKRVHCSIADILEEGNEGSEDLSRILAYHYNNAEEWKKAVKYSVIAGKHAADEFRNQDALHHYSTAMNIIEEHTPDERETLAECNFLSGSVRELIGDFEQASSHYEKAVSFSSDISLEGNAVLGLAEIFFTQGKLEEGMEIINNLSEKLELNNNCDMTLTLRIAAFRAWTFCVTGEIHRAMEEALLAVETGENLTNITEFQKARKLGHALNTLATVHWAKGEYGQAKELYERAISIALENHMKREAALTYGNIGLVLEKQGKFLEASQHMEKQLKMANLIGDKLLILSAHGELCTANAQLGNFESALFHGKEQERLAEALGAKHDTLLAYNHLAAIHTSMGHSELGKELAEKALESAIMASYEREEAFALLVLGEIEANKENLVSATDLLSRAKVLALKVNSSPLLQAVYLETAKVMISLGNFDKSEEALRNVQDLLTKTETQTGTAAYNCLLGNLHAAQGRMEEAFHCFNNGISIYRQLDAKPANAKACRSFAFLLRKLDSGFRSEADQYMTIAEGLYRDMKLPDEADKCGAL